MNPDEVRRYAVAYREAVAAHETFTEVGLRLMRAAGRLHGIEPHGPLDWSSVPPELVYTAQHDPQLAQLRDEFERADRAFADAYAQAKEHLPA